MGRTKIYRVVALVAALALIAAACGGDDDDSTATAEPTATEVAEPTATSEPEPTATPEPEPTATPEPEPTATAVPADDGGQGEAGADEDDPTAAASDEGADADPELVLGASVFASSCSRCHGAAGEGGIGPPIGGGILPAAYPDRAELITLVVEGRGRMPAFAEQLTAEEIEAVVRHIYEVL